MALDKAARRRWAILLSLLALTLAAIFYPGPNENVVYATSTQPLPHSVAKNAAQKMPQPVTATQDSLAKLRISDNPGVALSSIDQGELSGDELDPFAPRGWQAPPPPEPVAPKVVTAAVAPEAPVAPIGPPPLPFRFVGSMMDNEQQVIYLGRGEQALVARNGETLDGTYKVLSINTQQIEFEYLPTGDKQSLSFPTPNTQ
jgi:hypothetical protein